MEETKEYQPTEKEAVMTLISVGVACFVIGFMAGILLMSIISK